MKKEAWATASAWAPGAWDGGDIGACDLERALSVVSELERRNRASCPTWLQVKADRLDGTTGVQGCNRVGVLLQFGRKAKPGRQHRDCSVSVELLNPSGYFVGLNVPRLLFGLIRRPDSYEQYDTKNAASCEQLTTIIRAFFERPDKELLQWVRAQPCLKPAWKDD